MENLIQNIGFLYNNSNLISQVLDTPFAFIFTCIILFVVLGAVTLIITVGIHEIYKDKFKKNSERIFLLWPISFISIYIFTVILFFNEKVNVQLKEIEDYKKIDFITYNKALYFDELNYPSTVTVSSLKEKYKESITYHQAIKDIYAESKYIPLYSKKEKEELKTLFKDIKKDKKIRNYEYSMLLKKINLISQKYDLMTTEQISKKLNEDFEKQF